MSQYKFSNNVKVVNKVSKNNEEEIMNMNKLSNIYNRFQNTLAYKVLIAIFNIVTIILLFHLIQRWVLCFIFGNIHPLVFPMEYYPTPAAIYIVSTLFYVVVIFLCVYWLRYNCFFVKRNMVLVIGFRKKILITSFFVILLSAIRIVYINILYSSFMIGYIPFMRDYGTIFESNNMKLLVDLYIMLFIPITIYIKNIRQQCCPNCGKRISLKQKFCKNCGSKL